LEKLGINLGYLIVQILNFAILFLVLKKWVYTPILGLLEKRRETIAQGLEQARIAAEARANAEKEAEKIILEAQTKANEIIREATERAEAAAREIRTSTEAEAAKFRENAKADVEKEKERLLLDVRPQVVTLAISAAQKLIGEALDEKRQRELLEQFFSGIKEKKVLLLEGEQPKGASAEVISALPLTLQEQETIKKDLLAKVDSHEVHFRVDTTILGGIIIKVGDRVLDGSVAGQLENMRQGLS
jgi:F-type H+-transporting ATPase subunit b